MKPKGSMGMREFRIDNVYPWGRSMDEYRRMFDLSDADLAGRIVGCGDGPASFNAEATRLGSKVVSCDPLYAYSVEGIRRRIDETFPVMLGLTRREAKRFVWKDFADPEALGNARMVAMRVFLEDYTEGLAAGRYLNARLPQLPLGDDSASLALCSHFLFLYSDEFSLEFHAEAIREMLRVAPEARIFPLLTIHGSPSPHLDLLMGLLSTEKFHCMVERVNYEFQRGGDRQLIVRRG